MLSYRIKKARLNKGWNQGELAEHLGKSRTAVVNWETGYSKPEHSTLTEISSLLNVETNWLLDTSNDELELLEMSVEEDREREMTDTEKIGARMRYFRKRKNLTGEQVAKVLNISRASISGYERGRREPNFETLILLSKLYEMSIDHLLGITNSENNPFSIENEPWISDILAASKEKKLAIKKIWETINYL